MTPEMMQAYLDVRHVTNQALYVGYACLVMTSIVLILKVIIYRSVLTQLHVCQELLQVIKATVVVADRRREDAQQSLEEIKKTVESIPCLPGENAPAQEPAR